MSDAADPPIYPRYCFHLAPTVNNWCPLRVVDIHALKQHEGFEGENFYFYKNLPMKWVRIVGVVVAVDEYTGRRIFTVDDSSGACIECAVTIPVPENEDEKEDHATRQAGVGTMAGSAPQVTARYEGIDVGSVVDVKGGLATFREEMKINIEKMVALRSTEQEVALWEKRARFREDVLDKPWVLRNRDIRSCRKEAERSEEEAARKKKRLKAMIEGGLAKQPGKPTKEATRDDKKPRSHPRLDLRQVIQSGAKGKYDALGL